MSLELPAAWVAELRQLDNDVAAVRAHEADHVRDLTALRAKLDRQCPARRSSSIAQLTLNGHAVTLQHKAVDVERRLLASE